MKRTSTIIYKLTFLLSFFSIVFSASAEEYKSMIRYDRIWEHISINWNKKTVYYVKFDGTEEINGKLYHRLVSFRKARYDYDKDLQPYIFDVDENYYEHEGYMREEEGRVYTLISNVECDDDWFHGNLYIPNGNEAHPADLREMLLYDFTCKEGESYRGLQVNAHYADEMSYKVKSIEFVEIEGEEHRVIRIWPDDEHEYMNGEPIVEGVGIASYGCLTTINFLWLPSCPCMDYIFNRVLSTDGRVLYCAKDDTADIPLVGFLGVDNIAAQSKENEAPIYDILGRRIAEPAPGQLYIQGGKKYIAR
ncbi:MAG: hypothetical protein K2G77_09305 [Muribaculaceae bacterium]|nr:hypothetical protein [Muribaculaceae bacterium]